jgi:hypothetical protein
MAKAKSAAAPTSDAKASPPTSKTEPRARVRMYRQGLGDCLYVELLRGQQAPFRIMIDCGLVLGAKGATTTMQAVMADLVDTLGSASLDLLVVTHPHWDHVSGFLQAKDDFAKINADAVWLGWPEDPADPLAVKLSSIHAGAETALRASIDKLTALGLNENARQTQSLIDFLGAAPSAGGGTTRDAVKAAAAKVRVPRYCRPADPPVLIPGTEARIFVLGPPRDEAELRQMDPTSRNPETYSLTALDGLYGLAGVFGEGEEDDQRPFNASVTIPLADARQLAFFRNSYAAADVAWRRIDTDWLEDTQNFALLLDRAVNNSSLVLAIELEPGGPVLLFAADAQVGNWLSWLKLRWTIGDRVVTGPDLIARTIVYKVGHHASLNASLRAEGVERMNDLQYAFVPVDAVEAKAKGWGGNIPFAALLEALKRQTAPAGAVLRSDEIWSGTDPAITPSKLAYEVLL